MKITINENFENYRREFWKGLTLRQTLHAAGGVAAGILAYCIAAFLFGVPSDAAVWIALPASLPVIVPGFVRIQGMSVAEWARRMMKVRGASYTYKCEFLLEEEEARGVKKSEDVKKKANAAGREKVFFEPAESVSVIDLPGETAD